MINALIQKRDQTAVLKLPDDPFTLQYDLSQIGIRSQLQDIRIKDEEDSEIQVKLFADSDIGNSLAVLFKPSHPLEDANLCAHMVENARPELLEELEQHIVHGQYYSPQAVMADIKAMTEELIGVTFNYYCPLQIHMTDEEYGDWLEVDNGYGIANEDAIRELVKHEQDCDLHNMADYFNGSAGAKTKLISADWDVQEVGGELYGVIRTGLRAPFSPEEEQEWIDELIGQAADGFGEGLEQREIKTDDGDIYVSFWHSGEDYFMENETDFRQRMSNGHKQIGTTTEQGKYCGKYALTELLVCGECGTPYRRCTWTAGGQKKIVWRCISRLDYGKKYCHHSPTMEEAPLQEAVMNAILKTAKSNPDILQTLKMHIQMGLGAESGEDESIDIQIRIAQIDKEFNDILNTVTAENPESLLTDPRIEAMMSEKRTLEQKLAEYSAAEQHRKNAISQLDNIFTVLDGMKNHPLTFDNEIIRKILQCVIVESKDRIKVVFLGGLEVEAEVEQ